MKGHWGSWGLGPRDPCSENAVPAVGQVQCSLSHMQWSLTAIAAGLCVRVEAVAGASGEADVGAPEGWAQALCRAVADSLQLTVTWVHFQSMPRESEREVRRQMAKGYPACTFAWRLKLRAASVCSLPTHTLHSLLSHHTISFLCTFLLSPVPRELYPTDSEQVIGLQSPCQTSCA